MAETGKEDIKKVPPFTLLLIVSTFLLIVFCIVFLIYPQYQAVKEVRAARVSKTILLEKQKKIFPLYAQATAMAKEQFEPKLPVPERKALDREKITDLSKIFSDIAMSHQMELAQHNLDIESFKNESESISMDVKLNGNFYNYRNCLIAFAELPFFNRIDRININTDPSNVRKFSTRILLNIEKK